MPTARGGRIRQAREADILRAAAGVFAAEGFAGATMQDIATAELPVASIGSTTMTVRSWMSSGSFR